MSDVLQLTPYMYKRERLADPGTLQYRTLSIMEKQLSLEKALAGVEAR